MSDPKIRAKFQLKDGKPLFVEQDGLKHYKIVLSVEDPPPDAEAVMYKLHETYLNPVREVMRRPGVTTFDEKITSFGDFDIKTLISGSSKTSVEARTKLSSALAAEYEGTEDNPQVDMSAVRAALKEIKGL